MVKGFAKKDKKKKMPVSLYPNKIAPVDFEHERENNTQTPVTSLPATFIPAPGGYQGKIAQETRYRLKPDIRLTEELTEQLKKKYEQTIERIHSSNEQLWPDIHSPESLPDTETIYRLEKDAQRAVSSASSVGEVYKILNDLHSTIRYLPGLYDITSDKLRDLCEAKWTMKMPQFTDEDFYTVYAASLLVLDRAPSAVIRIVLNIVDRFAQRLVSAAHIAGSHELMSVSSFPYDVVTTLKYFTKHGGMDNFLVKLGHGEISNEELEFLFRAPFMSEGAYGGPLWGTIVGEAAKLEKMLPVVPSNINHVMAQVDHVVDLEHNNDLFLNNFYKGNFDHIGDLLDEKTEKWDWDVFKTKAPQMYNIYMQLKRLHLARIKGFTRIAQVIPGSALQQHPLVDTPQIEIDPSIKAEIEDAVQQLTAADPGYFQGVSKIVALHGGPFGQVSSEDPSIIHLNVDRIKNEVKAKLGSFSTDNPEHREAFEEAVKHALVEVIAHERGHVGDWDPEHGFPGGEGKAEQESRQMLTRIFPKGGARRFCKRAQQAFQEGDLVQLINDPEHGTLKITGHTKEGHGVTHYQVEYHLTAEEQKERMEYWHNKPGVDPNPVMYQYVPEDQLARVQQEGSPSHPGQMGFPNSPAGGFGGGTGYHAGLRGFCKRAVWEEEDDPDAADWWKPEGERGDKGDNWQGLSDIPISLPKLALPAIPIDPKQFKFQAGDKVQHEEIPGSVGTILQPFWIGQMYDDIDKTDPEYTNPWYEIQWEIVPDAEPYRGREPEGVLEEASPSLEELKKWFKESGIKRLCKMAQYSSDTIVEWQQALQGIEEEYGGKIVSMPTELPTLWQEILIRAYKEGGDELVKAFNGLPYLTIVVPFEKGQELSVHAFTFTEDSFSEDEVHPVTLTLGKGAISKVKQGDIKLVGYINQIVMHEFKHLMDGFTKDSQWLEQAEKKREEYIGQDSQYALLTDEVSAIAAEVAEAVRDLKEQGYSYEQIEPNIIERTLQWRQWEHTRELEDLLKRLIKEAYENDTITPGAIYKEVEETAKHEPWWKELLQKVLHLASIKSSTKIATQSQDRKVVEVEEKAPEPWQRRLLRKFKLAQITGTKRAAYKYSPDVKVEKPILDSPNVFHVTFKNKYVGTLIRNPTTEEWGYGLHKWGPWTWGGFPSSTHALWELLDTTGIEPRYPKKRVATAGQTLTIGLDIDGVLCDLQSVLFGIASKYVPLNEEDWEEYKIQDIEHGSDELKDKVFEEAYETRAFANAPVIPDAVDKVNELYDEGHKIILITARPTHWEEQTKEWLNNIGLKYHKLFVGIKDKGAKAKEEHVDVFVDDQPDNLEDVAKENIPAYAFEQPWNKGVNVPRIKDWKDVKAAAVLNFADRTRLENEIDQVKDQALRRNLSIELHRIQPWSSPDMVDRLERHIQQAKRTPKTTTTIDEEVESLETATVQELKGHPQANVPLTFIERLKKDPSLVTPQNIDKSKIKTLVDEQEKQGLNKIKAQAKARLEHDIQEFETVYVKNIAFEGEGERPKLEAAAQTYRKDMEQLIADIERAQSEEEIADIEKQSKEKFQQVRQLIGRRFATKEKETEEKNADKVASVKLGKNNSDSLMFSLTGPDFERHIERYQRLGYTPANITVAEKLDEAYVGMDKANKSLGSPANLVKGDGYKIIANQKGKFYNFIDWDAVGKMGNVLPPLIKAIATAYKRGAHVADLKRLDVTFIAGRDNTVLEEYQRVFPEYEEWRRQELEDMGIIPYEDDPQFTFEPGGIKFEPQQRSPGDKLVPLAHKKFFAKYVNKLAEGLPLKFVPFEDIRVYTSRGSEGGRTGMSMASLEVLPKTVQSRIKDWKGVRAFCKRAQVATEEVEVEEKEPEVSKGTIIREFLKAIMGTKSPDKMVQIITEFEQKFGKETMKEVVDVTPEVAFEHIMVSWGDWIFDAPVIELQQFEGFYAIQTLMDLLKYAPSGFLKYVFSIVDGLASVMLRAIYNGINQHAVSALALGVDSLKDVQQTFDSVDAFFRKVRDGKASMSEMVKFAKISGLEGNWYILAEAAAEVEKMLPANTGNIEQLILALDHLMDLEHDGGLILGDYAFVYNRGKGGRGDNDFLNQAEINQILTDKTNSWTIEDIKAKAPVVYNMLNYLDIYRRAKIGVYGKQFGVWPKGSQLRCFTKQTSPRRKGFTKLAGEWLDFGEWEPGHKYRVGDRVGIKVPGLISGTITALLDDREEWFPNPSNGPVPYYRVSIEEISPSMYEDNKEYLKQHPLPLVREMGEHMLSALPSNEYISGAPTTEELVQMFRWEHMKGFTKQASQDSWQEKLQFMWPEGYQYQLEDRMKGRLKIQGINPHKNVTLEKWQEISDLYAQVHEEFVQELLNIYSRPNPVENQGLWAQKLKNWEQEKGYYRDNREHLIEEARKDYSGKTLKKMIQFINEGPSRPQEPQQMTPEELQLFKAALYGELRDRADTFVPQQPELGLVDLAEGELGIDRKKFFESFSEYSLPDPEQEQRQEWQQDPDWWKKSSILGFTKQASPRWSTEEKNRLKKLYMKYRERGVPHHIIYKAVAELLGKSYLAVKQKLESMYDIEEELKGMKFEHWDRSKIDQMVQDLYRGGQPINRLSLPAVLMYQITNHSRPKSESQNFETFYNSFDEAMASNILAVGFEREGDKLTEKPISTLEDALRFYRRQEKQAHAWEPQEIVALFKDAHAAGLPLTYSFFRSHPTIYMPLLGVGRSLEGLKDSIKRAGRSWSDMVMEAAPEYATLYRDNGRLRDTTEEIRIRRFLELNNVPFRRATFADKIEVTDPELQEMGYRHFVPDFFILDGNGQQIAIVEVFGSVADSGAANTSQIYREKREAKQRFYPTLPYQFIAINNNAEGVELSDVVLNEKFADFIQR